jgi:hypothetical protein
MRQIKVIALSLVILSVLITCFSLLIPGNSRISRAITIKKPGSQIIPELASLNHWVRWHPFLKKISGSNPIQYSNDNKQLLVNQYDFKILDQTDSSIRFLSVSPNGEKMNSTVSIYSFGDSTAVNWYNETHVNWYPWEKFKTIFYDNIYGPSLDSNLVAFKYYMENKQ